MSHLLPAPCPDCGHPHESPALGSICIGCPCLSVPAITRRRPALVQANADDYPDAGELSARRARVTSHDEPTTGSGPHDRV
jgi:hypothetical protein